MVTMANNSKNTFNKQSLVNNRNVSNTTIPKSIPTDSGCPAGQTLCGYYDTGNGVKKNCCSRAGSCSHFKNTEVSTCVGMVCGIPDYRYSTCCQSPTVLCQGYCPNGMPYPTVQCIDPNQSGWCNPPQDWCDAHGRGYTTSTSTTTQPATTTVAQTTRSTTTLPLPTTTSTSTSTTTISPTTYAGSSTTTRAATSTTSTSTSTSTSSTSTTTLGPLKGCSFWGNNTYKQCDIPNSLNTDVQYIACGVNHSLISRLSPTYAGFYVIAFGAGKTNTGNPNYGQSNISESDSKYYGPVAAGKYHSHAKGMYPLVGQIKSWGLGSSGQCNVPDTTNMPNGNANWEMFATYDNSSIGVQSYGGVFGGQTVFTWGSSVERSIPSDLKNTPIVINNTPFWHKTTSLTAGDGFFATTENFYSATSSPYLPAWGKIYIWGYKASSIDVDTTDNPNQEYTQVAAGTNHLAALKNGRVYVFGNYLTGTNYGWKDVPAAALSGVVAIASGYNHILALKRDGTIVAWGDNREGQCNVPTNNGNNKATVICAGGNNSGAIWKYTNNYNPAGWAFPSTTTTTVATTTRSTTTTTTIGQQQQ